MGDLKVKSSDSPRVSVIMTTYNGAVLLADTIEAILNQTYRDFEFIIVDDGSTDGTVDIIKNYDDDRIRFLPNEKNMGISLSRNRAMSLAKGEFLVTTDQDDISFPERLERQVHYLDSHPNLVIVSANVVLQRGSTSWPDPSPSFTNPSLVHLALFFGHHNISYSTLCARLRILRQHGLEFLQEYHYAEDFEFYHRVAKIGDIITLPDVLVCSRIHEYNTSILCRDDMSVNGLRFLSKAYNDLLGRNVETKEMKTVWRLMVMKKTAHSYEELNRAGRIIEAVVTEFEKRYVSTATDFEEVYGLASLIWWYVVRASATSLGPGALKAYGSYPVISKHIPSNREKIRIIILSVIPMKIRAFLRDAIKGQRGKAPTKKARFK